MPPAAELVTSWLRALLHLQRVVRCYALPAYRSHTLIAKLQTTKDAPKAVGISRKELKEAQYICCYWLALLASLAVESALRAFFSFVPLLDILLAIYFNWLARSDWENARFMYYALLGPLAKRVEGMLGALGKKLGVKRFQETVTSGARGLAEKAQNLAPKVSGTTGFSSLPV